jgi:hypothetical protein
MCANLTAETPSSKQSGVSHVTRSMGVEPLDRVQEIDRDASSSYGRRIMEQPKAQPFRRASHQII